MELIFSFPANKIFQFITALLLILILSSQFIPQTKSHYKKMGIKLFSSSFKEGDFIPKKYSCEGSDISPQLHWSNMPKGVKSFSIIVEDPDAPGGNFVHWIIFSIPGNFNELHEDVAHSENIPGEIIPGTNGFGQIGYGGPCPPTGKPHRYIFKIYALDTVLHHLETGATKQQLLNAMKGHIIAEGQLTGKYQRVK
jgi:Raf kinase inhibitor-like YbhB/YbcL family protein